MSRKKNTDVETPEQPKEEIPVATNGEKKKPVASWLLNSDKTTRLECSIWANEMHGQDGATWTQYSVTFRRSYKDNKDSQWYTSTSYRGHDLPILDFLIRKAQDFVLSMRTSDSSIPL